MRVLLVGNTGYITERFMEEAFPECQALILGDAQVRTNRKKGIVHRPFPEEEAEQETVQLDFFADPAEAEQERKMLEKEKTLQKTVLGIQKQFGKNAILKGMDLEEGATAQERNRQIGGHKA